jgi:hypothetical protein
MEASSNASKARHDRMVRMVQSLVQKCTIQSPQSGKFVFDWLGLGVTCASVCFNSLPEHVSFLAGSLDSAPIPSPPPSPPISPPLPPPPPITIIDNVSSRYRVHRNRLQPSRTHTTQAAADEPINPMDNLITRYRALRKRLQTPRTYATQATAAEPISSTIGTFSSLRALHNRFQQARTQMPTNSTDTRRFFPGRHSPS